MKRIATILGVAGLLAFGGVAVTGGTSEAATNVCGNSVNIGSSSGGAHGQTCVNGQVKGNTGNGFPSWLAHLHSF